MSTYPTDISILTQLTETEWEKLLSSVWNAPVPRTVVRVPETNAKISRRERIEALLALGLNQRAVAAQLNLSVSLVCRALKGER